MVSGNNNSTKYDVILGSLVILTVFLIRSETDFNAMNFCLWNKIGSEFMIKSNINNWVACSEGTGSLVNWVSGTIKCKLVKDVTGRCLNVVPNAFLTSMVNVYSYICRQGIFCWTSFFKKTCRQQRLKHRFNHNATLHGSKIKLVWQALSIRVSTPLSFL